MVRVPAGQLPELKVDETWHNSGTEGGESATGEPIPVGRHALATSARLTAEALHQEFKRALRKGARASRLVRYSPNMVELLASANDQGERSLHDRAIAAEQIIRQAIDHIGGESGEALATIFCLKPGTLGLTLDARRRMAADLLGVRGDTFRRERHEGLLVWDLAMEVYRIARWTTSTG